MKTLIALAALALPGLAAAEDKYKAYTGTLEFSFGFGGTGTFEPDTDGDSKEFFGNAKSEGDLSTTLAITPGLDKMLGKTIGIGLEYGFNWIQSDEDLDKNRQLVMTPMARLRMAFPVYDKVTFDGMFALGAALWTADADFTGEHPLASLRVGWALRFNFGGSYQFNDSVAAFGSVGYFTTTSYGDDLSATYDAIPLNLGLRGGF
jgi:hypothetical protein